MTDPSPSIDLSDVVYDRDGLVPCVVQEWRSGEVLMVAWMNRDALEHTLDTGMTWFWSRSRQELWHKGATSGNVQRVRELRLDCDGDTLLALVEQTGHACHTGTPSCFSDRALAQLEGRRGGDQAEAADRQAGDSEGARELHRGRYAADAGDAPPFLAVDALFRLIEGRRQDPPPGSYTATLFAGGPEAIGAKVEEEAAELAEAARDGDRAHAVYEAGDLFYHLLVLFADLGITPADVWAELERRRGS